MTEELHKLRIDKSHKASRHEPSRWPLAALILLLLAGGGAAGAWYWQKSNAALPVETLRVRVPEASAVTSNDLVLLNATGYIMAAHKIELASKVIGRVAWVGVEMGDKVKAGDVLVRLENEEFKSRVQQQQGQLDNAKARLAELEAGSRTEEVAQAEALYNRAKVEYENAQRNFVRINEIKTTRSISQPELDDAESLMNARKAQMESVRQQYELMKAGPRKEQIAAQRATVHQLEGNLALAQQDLDNTVIRAPGNATILERNVEVGEFVTTGFVGDRGAKGYVVSIADLNDLLVELDISQNNFASVTADQPCWIVTDAYPDKKYDGVVERISPVANRQKATILVRVKVTNPDHFLKPDMNATVSFLSPKAATNPGGGATSQVAERPALRIPANAVRSGGVFVLENEHAVRRTVTTGRTSTSGDIEIKTGLSGGENLILNPPESLKDGDKVRPAEPKH